MYKHKVYLQILYFCFIICSLKLRSCTCFSAILPHHPTLSPSMKWIASPGTASSSTSRNHLEIKILLILFIGSRELLNFVCFWGYWNITKQDNTHPLPSLYPANFSALLLMSEHFSHCHITLVLKEPFKLWS